MTNVSFYYSVKSYACKYLLRMMKEALSISHPILEAAVTQENMTL